MATAEVVPCYYRLLLSTLSAILLPTTYHNTTSFHLPTFRGLPADQLGKVNRKSELYFRQGKINNSKATSILSPFQQINF